MINLPSHFGTEVVMLEYYYVKPATVDRILANVARPEVTRIAVE